ncbi:MAG: hypothetical protein COV52_05040 [Gammaproteobacteria bacterium CG11_big_fil_rev_8_21_14_0_20_46_22]|nr:MAG: hypothetical protein COW05_04805 [Gammaproteobacteria bacterium CG12_big_fil_rev_8_21_14_0_65_46_12]PIR11229.1 MAG: hypothetical protein COV52_05040 [Gammaproteobacteria bacterium CG11_big_fil_rev_8_21_14_0_20_46_22]
MDKRNPSQRFSQDIIPNFDEKLIEEAKHLDEMINVKAHYSVATAESTGHEDAFFDLNPTKHAA